VLAAGLHRPGLLARAPVCLLVEQTVRIVLLRAAPEPLVRLRSGHTHRVVKERPDQAASTRWPTHTVWHRSAQASTQEQEKK
jgi:hypothetical protein